MNETLERVRRWCQDRCADLFETTLSRCEQRHRSSFDAAHSEDAVARFAQVEKNRFWTLYYTYAQKRTARECRSCYRKFDACTAYVTDRLPSLIRSFDMTQESALFKRVRERLCESGDIGEKDADTERFVSKIKEDYARRKQPKEKASALVCNAVYEYDASLMIRCEHHAQGHLFYGVPIVLESLLKETVAFDSAKEAQVRRYLFEEMVHYEKFVSYIGRSLKNRVVDFTRSAAYKNEVSEEIDESAHCDEPFEEEDSQALLEALNDEQTTIYRLKYGFRLDDAAFLEVVARLDYRDDKIVSRLSNEEKFYIQLKTRYGLSDDSEALQAFDTEALQKSISEKIALRREEVRTYDYNDYVDDDKKEIYLKLIYAEPLSAKEIGIIFDKTAKQIDKKIENAKKRLKSGL